MHIAPDWHCACRLWLGNIAVGVMPQAVLGLPQNHALADQPLEWLLGRHRPNVVQHLWGATRQASQDVQSCLQG